MAFGVAMWGGFTFGKCICNKWQEEATVKKNKYFLTKMSWYKLNQGKILGNQGKIRKFHRVKKWEPCSLFIQFQCTPLHLFSKVCVLFMKISVLNVWSAHNVTFY